jgi:steroid 5-alpha reductase family enzyme
MSGGGNIGTTTTPMQRRGVIKDRPSSSNHQRPPATSMKAGPALSGLLRGGGGSVFSNAPLWTSSKIILGANALGWLINVAFPKCHYHVDLLGTGAFAVAAAATVGTSTGCDRTLWSSRAVVVWSVRLASFLLYRVLHTGHDSRLDEQLSNPFSAGQFWIVSALWGLVCGLPHSLGTTSSLPGSPAWTRIGGLMAATGIIVESLADYQKWTFKQNHPGGSFCNVGVWSISQHPNWFGNLLLWSGILVMNAPALIDPRIGLVGGGNDSDKAISFVKKYGRLAVAALGPMFLLTLFNAQATGALFNDSFQANRAKYGYGTDPTYTTYVNTVPVLFPNPLRGWFS